MRDLKMQKPPVACRPLVDWLGQTVRFRGYLSLWKTADKTGDTACLLENVRVVPYKGSEENVRILDHLWIYLDKNNHDSDGFERLGEYTAVGQVVSYIRSNGTKDYAIEIKSYVSIEEKFELLQLCKKFTLNNLQTRVKILKRTIDLLQVEELNFSIHIPYQKVFQLLQDEYELWNRQAEVNQRYQAKRTYRPRPKPEVIRFPSTASKSNKSSGKGFARI
jgi:hypothetical protein